MRVPSTNTRVCCAAAADAPPTHRKTSNSVILMKCYPTKLFRVASINSRGAQNQVRRVLDGG
jgi:hypothetical protein